ncbi:MAG TPA: succinylglutamate desuccinylase/aspartoacylase family protein, partial [Vicinamibacteria bacterium]
MAATIRRATLYRDRVIGRISAPEPGATLIVIGAIHGNEPAGVEALESVVRRISEERLLLRGDFVALVGNVEALDAGARYIDFDLNRHWSKASLASLEGAEPPMRSEDRERRELWRELAQGLAAARGETALLDLHTTSGEGKPFAVFADTLKSRSFARKFPVPSILGFEENLEGTLADYVALDGHLAV